MPLVVEGVGKAVARGDLRAIGFWMTVKGAVPVQPVRIFVSYEAFAQLAPLDIRDFAAAFKHFDRFRSRIEAAASEKFDREGADPEKYEGMPTVRLTPLGRARPEAQDKVSGATKENEIRRLVSKAWSRRRRWADSPSVYEARHLDLNHEFEERRGEGVKLFFLILFLFALLVFAVSQLIGLELA